MTRPRRRTPQRRDMVDPLFDERLTRISEETISPASGEVKDEDPSSPRPSSPIALPPTGRRGRTAATVELASRGSYLIRVPQRPQLVLGFPVHRTLPAPLRGHPAARDPGEEARAQPGGFEASASCEIHGLPRVFREVEEGLGIAGAAQALALPPVEAGPRRQDDLEVIVGGGVDAALQARSRRQARLADVPRTLEQ